jgi:hypothetical protein
MTNLKIKVNLGIGDLIHIKSQLELVKHKYGCIYITPNSSILAESSRGKNNYDYLSFLRDFINLLFSDEPYCITPFCELDDEKQELIRLLRSPPDYQQRDAPKLKNIDKIPYQYPCLASKLCFGSSLDIQQKYIVLTTRARDFSSLTYENIKQPLFDAINDVAKSKNIKVLLLGDRDMGKTLDVTVHGIFSIYDDILSYLDPSIIIDRTVEKPLASSPIGLRGLQQDCLWMNESLGVISLGIGGNVSLSVASESRVISLSDFTRPLHDIWQDLYYEKTNLLDFLKCKNEPQKRILVTKDTTKFLEYIKNMYV